MSANWIVKNQKPESEIEPYEVRVKRVSEKHDMASWTDEQIEAMRKNFGHECQEAAHYIKRQRENERTPLSERMKYSGAWTS